MAEYQIFISFKNTDAEGQPTRDSILAKEVYDYLIERAMVVFFSSVELEAKGTTAWRRAIDSALDSAQILIVIGTCLDHFNAEWVIYEWEGFSNDILSKIKPNGRIFVYTEGMRARNLPRGLRNETVIPHGSGSVEMLYNYVKNALAQIEPEQSPVSTTTKEATTETQNDQGGSVSPSTHEGHVTVIDWSMVDKREQPKQQTSTPAKTPEQPIRETPRTPDKSVGTVPAREISVTFPEQPEQKEESSRPPPLSKQKPSVREEEVVDLNVLDLGFGCRVSLVWVPEGDVVMGSDPKKDADFEENEMPQHRYHLPGFYIGKSPITVAQFGVFIRNAGHMTLAEKHQKGYAFTHQDSDWVQGADWMHPRGPQSSVSRKNDHPVTQVAYADALAFCAWASQVSGRQVRLPNEAEWERAARGDNGYLYPWGDSKPNGKRCNFGGDMGDTTPVGKYSPLGDSQFGCIDMAGNVWEWTSSVEKPYPYQAENVKGSHGHAHRVLRGGSYFEGRELVRCACRKRGDASFRCDQWGFRLLVEA